MREPGRRLVHASGSLLPIGYVIGILAWEHVEIVLSLGLGIALGLEFVRLRRGLDWWIYEKLTREYEREQVAGYALYMIGMAIVGFVFEPPIAVPAMLMLAIGDPVSGILGDGNPDRKPTWVQSVMFGTCFLIAFPFSMSVLGAPGSAMAAAAAAALAAALADGNPIVIRDRYVDDNLTIPLAGAVTLWVALSAIAG